MMNIKLNEQSQKRLIAMTHHIQSLIDECDGFITLRDYIEAALYTPKIGYYESGEMMIGNATQGSGGDFITAPELTPLFARAWAAPIAEALAQSPFFYELGGGSGQFCVDLLTALHEKGTLPERYTMIEKSAAQRARQLQTVRIKAPHLLDRVLWVDTLPEKISGAVLMNEVLDAMPPRVLVRRDGAWFERGVTLEDNEITLSERELKDSQDRAIISIAQSRAQEEGDFVVEINESAETCIETIACAIKESQTRAPIFICDYGFEREKAIPERYRAGTLRGFYRHQLVDNILALPGLVDITSHVDFVAMVNAAQKGGLNLKSFDTQKDWLIKYSILDHLATINHRDPVRATQHTRAVQTLISTEAMGEIFKVLVAR